jgi:DNA mismatch repair protein MutS2
MKSWRKNVKVTVQSGCRQRVRITGSTSVGTIEKISRNKVIVNYGTFKTTIDADELERI